MHLHFLGLPYSGTLMVSYGGTPPSVSWPKWRKKLQVNQSGWPCAHQSGRTETGGRCCRASHTIVCGCPPAGDCFFGGFRQSPLPQKKEWRTVVWILDNRGQALQEGSDLKGLEELKEALASVDQVKWSHGYCGGKPMIPSYVRPPVRDSGVQCEPFFAK